MNFTILTQTFRVMSVSLSGLSSYAMANSNASGTAFQPRYPPECHFFRQGHRPENEAPW
ncbi:Uncharacterised protein [Klebsiella quasipneumoniae]|nr:Uncharacterised protein [Klebsiella quasipneumoniae]VGO85655.1 hypothetical protein SB01124_01136 [Klebsiella quasipneumoniae subsp. quasipneumoniae]VDA29238.1 hypothetical protein BANRA_01245 [Klebsiella quasipneumoniae]VGF99612.1 Uncharacterised protein [Klebsiella quasipneumoniae]VGO94069.1 hypothetical protein SB02110_01319 [Klebsiella quasipneumoniae subsp. quasipneumoniae]